MFKSPLIHACVVLTAAGIISARADLAQGLVAYWDFEKGAANVAPSGGVAYDGKMLGAAKLSSAAKVGTHALKLDGNSAYVHVAGPVDATKPWTLSAWFQPEAAPGPDTRRMIYESTGNFSISFGLRASKTPGAINTQVSSSTTGTKYLPANHDVPADTFIGKWHHVVEVYTPALPTQKGKIVVYLDGQQTHSVAVAAGDSLLAVDGLNLGTYREANGRWFEGRIDEVAFWNRALEASEAKKLMTLGENNQPIFAPGVVASDAASGAVSDGTEAESAPTSGSNLPLIIGGAVVVLALAGVGGFFLLRKKETAADLPPPPGH